MIKFTLLTLLFLSYSLVLKAEPSALVTAKIGPELTFESKETVAAVRKRLATIAKWKRLSWGLLGEVISEAPNEVEESWALKFKNAIMKNCPDCQLEEKEKAGKFGLTEFRIVFPNGFYINIGSDPGVVELQTPPLTLQEYKKLSPFIEDAIYRTAASIGLFPKLGNDSHTNIGALSAFPRGHQLAQFLLDQVNHPELALGVLGQDIKNAPPLVIQDKQQLRSFFQIMDEVGMGLIHDHKSLTEAISSRVYYRSLHRQTLSQGNHYQAWSIKRLRKESFPESDAPVEGRFTPGRTKFSDILLTYELILKRIDYLSKTREFANLQRDTPDMKNMDASARLSRFYIFLAEMGESLENYRGLVFLDKIRNAPLDNFVTGKIRWRQHLGNPMEAIEPYLPDLETSWWVRDQMTKILTSKDISIEHRDLLLRMIEERSHRDFIPSANAKVLGDYIEGLRRQLKNYPFAEIEEYRKRALCEKSAGKL